MKKMLRRYFGKHQHVGTLPPPPPVLSALTLSASTLNENSAPGTFIGTILGTTGGSTLSLVGSDGNRVAISSGSLVAGATNSNYETDTNPRSITIRETLAGATNTPRDTVLAYTVANLDDTNPNAFSFTDVSNVPLSTTETSNTITIAGLGASDSCTATLTGDASSQMQKNGGSWVSGPLTVVNGDTLAVRHTSSGSISTAVNTTLTVGTTSDTFTSTTGTAMSAGVLAFDVAGGWTTGQNPPALSISLPSDGSILLGDWYRVEYATNSGFASSSFGGWHQITSDDVLSGSISYPWGTTLAAGLTYFRMYFGRGANAGAITIQSPASNVINDTLNPIYTLQNGDFHDTSAWTLGSGCSISAGALHCTSAAQMCWQPITYVNGGIYQVDFDLTPTAGQKVRINLSSTNGADIVATSGFFNPNGTLQHQTLTFTANVSNGYISIEAENAVLSGTVDNVTLVKIG